MAVFNEKDLAVFESLKDECLDIFKTRPTVNVSEIALEMMSREDVPMHFPFHHFIVPASLLTAAAVSRGDSYERLDEMLETAKERSKNVLGGFCGNYGACGAGVGAGIFMSVYTDSSPVSAATWSWCNEITGRCLQKLASVEGPRCCKRTAFLSISEAVPYINEKLGTALTFNEDQICSFHERNKECKGKLCPFFPLKAAEKA